MARQRLECVELAPAFSSYGQQHGPCESAGKPGAVQTLRAVLRPSLRANLLGEPGPGVGPVALGHRLGNVEHLGGFFYRHTDEITELYQLGFLFVGRGKFFQDVVDREEQVIVLDRQPDIVQFDAPLAAAVTLGAFAARVIHQDTAHGFGRRGEEMIPVLPFPVLLPHKLKPGFVDERGWLEGLAGRFAGHFVGREFAKFLIDQR